MTVFLNGISSDGPPPSPGIAANMDHTTGVHQDFGMEPIMAQARQLGGASGLGGRTS